VFSMLFSPTTAMVVVAVIYTGFTPVTAQRASDGASK